MIYYRFNLSNQKEINIIINHLSKLTKEEVKSEDNELFFIGRHIRFNVKGLIEFDDGYNINKINQILRDLFLKKLYYCKGLEYKIKSISYPINDITNIQINNLKKLIYSKANIIKRALRCSTTDIIVDKEKIIFPWFMESNTNEEMNAYKIFIEKLINKSYNIKHLKMQKLNIINERYEFKNFINNLGLYGKKYENTRKILFQYLIGNMRYLLEGKTKEEQ